MRPRWRKKRWRFFGAVVLLLAVAIAAAWLSRRGIADDFIQDQLEAYDLPATYEVTRIGPRTQILSNVVIGDPDDPDFTAERVLVRLRYRLGTPQMAKVTLVEPRIYGSYRDGTLSFGELDKVLFRKTGQPPGLPEINLGIRDGRGLIETEYGPVGLKLEGAGLLNNGFAGIVAINAPELDFGDCEARRATAYGKIQTSGGEPEFSGPVRLASLVCESQNLAVENVDIELDARLSDELRNPSGEARLSAGDIRSGAYSADGLTGTIRATFADGALNGRYSLAARGVDTPQALAAVATAEGVVRARDGFDALEIESDIEGNGLRLGPELVETLEGLSRTGEGTLLEPIVRRLANALVEKSRGSAFEADLRVRKNGDTLTVLAPRAELRGGDGERILSLSRFEWSGTGEGAPRLSGNIATGGSGLPRISGRMERGAGGDAVFRLTMAPYEAGGSVLAIPQLTVAQGANGALGFSGRVVASGPLPGGSTRNLSFPVSGRYEPGGSLALWRECTEFRFDRLELANLRFEDRRITLCPPRGAAIVRTGQGGVRIAAGAPSLDLVGFLGETPIRIESGPVGFAYPGVMTARTVRVALGPAATASRFTISDLDARIGDNVAGSFADAEVRLANVPLDILEANGRWDYTAGKLTLADASFRLIDRAEADRFEPLVARAAALTLVDNIVNAQADLRHPASDRLVTVVTVRHNLATATGYADLGVPGVLFDERLQPDQLSRLALGVVANARGVVTGTGRIEWNQAGVTSTGQFSSESLDFAAAFGPVKGASGTVVFTDLLGLTTAPGQKLQVASINPGIEVLDGEVEFELRGGRLLAVKGGAWPFMGGTLILRDVDLNLGISEARRYVFEIVGLQASEFVQRMDLENLSATGTFDGTVPIVFDAQGNGRIDGGLLLSRPPGGNISYVGELTYEDLSPIANFAFDALRSLDYSQMSVAMEGPLTGEIVTRVRFDGISQGEGAKTNFITRQLGKLPIQFRINIRAQFLQLITSLKSLYDPAAVRDPRELGLLSDDGTRLRRAVTGEEAEPEIDPEDIIPGQPPIQD